MRVLLQYILLLVLTIAAQLVLGVAALIYSDQVHIVHVVYSLSLGTCEASGLDSIRIESRGPFRKFSNRPSLPIARRSQTTQTITCA